MIKDLIIRNYVYYYNKILNLRNNDPINIEFWIKRKQNLSFFTSKKDVLVPSARALRSKGEKIDIPELKFILKGMVIGNWSLDKDTIAFLWKQLQIYQPRTILECGSGVSTLLFSKYLKQYQPDGILISIEQSETQKYATEENLVKNRLMESVSILHFPVDENGRYQFDISVLHQELNNRKIDWLMVDGPAGKDGCRDNIISVLLPFMAPGAYWWMDDSFRDAELLFLQELRNNPKVILKGIYPIGKGIACGIIK